MVRNYLEIPADCTAAQFQSQMAAAETRDSHSKVSDGDFFFPVKNCWTTCPAPLVQSLPHQNTHKKYTHKNTLVIRVLFVVT